MNPLVSVLTVVYNGEKYLEQTIKSVIAQDYNNIEYVVIDGGSNDGTIDIIKRYQDHINIFVSESDKGIYNAINKGLRKCSGQLIKIINADDLLLPRAISAAVNTLKRNNLNDPIILIGNTQVIDIRGQIVGKITDKRIMFGFDTFNHPGWFVTTETYRQYGLYDEKYKISSDYEYYLRFKMNGGNIIRIPIEVTCYRQYGRSSGFEGVHEVAKINLRYFGPLHAAFVWAQHFTGKLIGYIKRKILNIKQCV